MATPFDICKSLTQTKDDLYTVEEVFNKEYTPFMVNRILSNSPATALFANAMNQFGIIDKKLQYDFYRFGIPKTKQYTKWIKKEALDIDQVHLDYLCSKLNVSLSRAIEIYGIIGSEAIQAEINKQGGKK
jgi:hypothetical protein